MTEKTTTLPGAGGLKLFARRWLPDGPVKARLLIVHGYAEHSGRYEHVARYLTDKGIAVYAYDLRGHGRSEGKTAYVERFELLLKDLTAALDWVRGKEKDSPIFLFGHSMSGAVVTLYVATRQPQLEGVILSGAALKISEDISPFLQRISGLLGTLAPTLKVVKLDPKLVSRDPAMVKAYVEDPMVYTGLVYNRTGAEMIKGTQQVQKALRNFNLPVLILHGTGDGLADPEGSRLLYQQAATEDKTLKLYEGAYHELVNEINREEVLADIYEWINLRSPSPA